MDKNEVVEILKELPERIAAVIMPSDRFFDYKGALSYAISHLEEDSWIPVSERLPEEKFDYKTQDFSEVLCTTVWDDVRTYKFGQPIGHDKAHFWDCGGIMDEYVIAWQYKPDPYKKGGKE